MSGHQDVATAPSGRDEGYERFSRARLFTVVAVVATLLTAWYMFHNVFLAPVTGIVGAFAAWRGIKNGGNRTLLLAVIVVCLIPSLLAIIALLTLLPNLPSLSFSHVKVVKG